MRSLLGLVLLLSPLAACGGPSENPDTGRPDRAPGGAIPAESPAAEAPREGVQIVQVTVEGEEYLFSPTTVEVGKPVRLVFDPQRLPGCSRDITLPAYHISKTIVEGDASIEFTPEVKGPIAVICTMNMYKGTLRAE